MKGFPKNARVCFIGDSITHDNGFVSYISAYYHENLKDREVNFYNCGVAGARIRTALPILDKDVLSHNPTHAVIMLGINDSSHWSLSLPKSLERYDILVNAYEIYQQNLREICKRLCEKNVEIILCTPTPYDEYQNTDSETRRGGYALIAGYAQCVRDFARELNYPLCDYHLYFSRTLQSETLIQKDRVHPNDLGQFHIAKCFLAFQGYDIGEYKPLPSYMDLWREKVSVYRNIWAAERLIIDKYDISTEEQLVAIKAYVEENEGDEEKAHIVGMGKKYLETKHLQDKLNEEINYLMEVEFKKR